MIDFFKKLMEQALDLELTVEGHVYTFRSAGHIIQLFFQKNIKTVTLIGYMQCLEVLITGSFKAAVQFLH